MNRSRLTTLTIALALALGSTACSEAADEARQTASEATQGIANDASEAAAEGGVMAEAFAEAAEEMRTENLPLGSVEGLPKAELTPQGDLLIDGVAVPMNTAQREAALAYRGEVVAIGEAGMAMGQKGMDIAGDALALAAKSMLGGDTAENEARIEAKGKAMEVEGLALCERVESLAAAQSRLAELLPEFKPYAEAMNVEADCNEASTTTDAEQQAEDAAKPTVTLST
ncbi:MAG: hypothetical protein ACRC2H_02875 [Silanimonas sp.]